MILFQFFTKKIEIILSHFNFALIRFTKEGGVSIRVCSKKSKQILIFAKNPAWSHKLNENDKIGFDELQQQQQQQQQQPTIELKCKSCEKM